MTIDKELNREEEGWFLEHDDDDIRLLGVFISEDDGSRIANSIHIVNIETELVETVDISVGLALLFIIFEQELWKIGRKIRRKNLKKN